MMLVEGGEDIMSYLSGMLRVGLSLGGVLLFAGPARADRVFTEVSEVVGILPYVAPADYAGGLITADYDNDGDIDIFVPNGFGVPDQLYQNQGNGTFLEVAHQAGVAAKDRNSVALWFDADNDDLLDLLVAGDCSAINDLDMGPHCGKIRRLRFYRQTETHAFVDQTDQAGFGKDIIAQHHILPGGICAGDINNDGYLDVFMGVWKGYPAPEEHHRLFLNNGDGTFTDVTGSQFGSSSGGTWQSVMHDFNRDGFIDIYTAVDYEDNRLWINQRDNTFVNVAPAVGADNRMNDMGVALGDFDNDLDLDIYVTNIFDFITPGGHNVLLRNDSAGEHLRFENIAFEAGVAKGDWGWGCTFLDMENNGFLDLAATNGFDLRLWHPYGGIGDPSYFFRNPGDPNAAFERVSKDVGFDDRFWGSALVSFDYNRDGWLDLAQSCIGPYPFPNLVRVLENRRSLDADPNQPENHYLVIKPRMCHVNRRAIGATVEVMAGDLKMMRLISAGCSFFGQEPAEAYFGLGRAEKADTVTIHWPGGGGSTQLSNVAADQILTVTTCPAPHETDPNQ